MILFD